MPKTITRKQYLQLLGLKLLADKHNQALDYLVEAAGAITGESNAKTGHTGDNMYLITSDVDQMLERLGIEVETST